MARISKKKFKEACKGSAGVQTVIAKSIGVTRGAIFLYLKRHPEMRKFLDEEGDKLVDIAEHNIHKEIVAGSIDDSWKLLLNSKRGKTRGYGQRQEFDVSDQRRIEILRANNGINKVETKPKAGTSSAGPK